MVLCEKKTPIINRDHGSVLLGDICLGCRTGNNRKLVVCIDGSSNQYSPNCFISIGGHKLIEDSRQQLTYYDGTSVQGTRSKAPRTYMKQNLREKFDLLIPRRTKKRILNAYTWLSDNYQEGDQIYLFGLSRGAYQARALAAMIQTVGLVERSDKERIPHAYQLYTSNKSGKARKQDRVKDFVEKFSRPIKVHSLGVWYGHSPIGLVYPI
ncbi:hypothetical protein CPB86DRAFT_719364 [Serendipita vermifera]|nr:hypothetical protein CPB86DRAFT_719364 [Serendipita vermifera]